MTDFKLLQQALDALEFPHDSEWSNKAKAIEALQHALAQPEFDTPESHIVKWSIPVDPNNFGEPLAQPEQDWDLLAATQESLREHQARIKKLEAQLAQPKQEFKYTPYGLRSDENGKLSIGEISQREWVGLTDDEKESVYKHADAENHQLSKVVSAVEWLLKDKNTT